MLCEVRMSTWKTPILNMGWLFHHPKIPTTLMFVWKMWKASWAPQGTNYFFFAGKEDWWYWWHFVYIGPLWHGARFSKKGVLMEIHPETYVSFSRILTCSHQPKSTTTYPRGISQASPMEFLSKLLLAGRMFQRYVGMSSKNLILGCPRRLGSMVSNWIISPTYKWKIPWGYNPFTIHWSIHFQQDIQVESRINF